MKKFSGSFRIRTRVSRKFRVPSCLKCFGRAARSGRWHDKAEMKDRFSPFPVAFKCGLSNRATPISPASFPPKNELAPRRWRPWLRAKPAAPGTAATAKRHRPIQPAKQMTLETNERRRRRRAGVCLLSVPARTEFDRPLRSRGRTVYRGPGGGARIRKYRCRIFVSVSQTILLNGSRGAPGEGGTRNHSFAWHPIALQLLGERYRFLAGRVGSVFRG